MQKPISLHPESLAPDSQSDRPRSLGEHLSLAEDAIRQAINESDPRYLEMALHYLKQIRAQFPETDAS